LRRKDVRTATVAAMLFLFLVLFLVNSASGITNGVPDGDSHPYVCIVVFYDSAGAPLWRTTGSLIAPKLVLTAGHGTFGASSARVWFETDVRDTGYPFGGKTSITGKVVTNPDYWSTPMGNGLKMFDSHDVGLVILSKAVKGIKPAQLPKANYVETLNSNCAVDLVGYGVQWQDHGDGTSPYDAWMWSGLRFYAPSVYITSSDAISGEFLKLTANPGQGKGGTAYGDSGGPILAAGTNLIIGINSFVTNTNCAGVTYAQRIDTADILGWIRSYL
jgi:hypothetical protein